MEPLLCQRDLIFWRSRNHSCGRCFSLSSVFTHLNAWVNTVMALQAHVVTGKVLPLPLKKNSVENLLSPLPQQQNLPSAPTALCWRWWDLRNTAEHLSVKYRHRDNAPALELSLREHEDFGRAPALAWTQPWLQQGSASRGGGDYILGQGIITEAWLLENWSLIPILLLSWIPFFKGLWKMAGVLHSQLILHLVP